MCFTTTIFPLLRLCCTKLLYFAATDPVYERTVSRFLIGNNVIGLHREISLPLSPVIRTYPSPPITLTPHTSAFPSYFPLFSTLANEATDATVQPAAAAVAAVRLYSLPDRFLHICHTIHITNFVRICECYSTGSPPPTTKERRTE